MSSSVSFIKWKEKKIPPSKKLLLVFDLFLVILSVYFLFLKDYFLSLIFWLAIGSSLVIYFFPSPRYQVYLDKEKIILNQKKFFLSDFDSFSIFLHPKGNSYLVLYPKKALRFSKEILLPRDELKITQIKKFLEKVLKEKKEVSEPLIDSFLRDFGF